METILATYLTEFLAVLSITILAIVSPGPDFIVVSRNSLMYSKQSGIFTGIGVAIAVWVHIFYTLAGIGLLLSKSILLFSIVKYLGAAYLIYLGIACIRSKGESASALIDSGGEKTISAFESFKMGFLTNMLNPKATLFFVSLFTQMVNPATPLSIQIAYGAIVSILCFVWFSLVAWFLNQKKIRAGFARVQRAFEKVMGVVLIGFGLKVAVSTSS